MPKVTERHGMRKSTWPQGISKGSRQFERHFIADGYADEAAARDAIAAATESDGTTLRMPPALNGAPLVSVDLEEEMRPDDLLAFVAKWELQNANGGGGGGGGGDVYDLSFTTGVVTEKATETLGTHTYVDSDGNSPPDFLGAIGVSESGVEGVDVIAHQWSEELTFYVDPSLVTLEFRRALFDLTATVNSDDFLYFAPGECRFDGATGSQQNGGNWRISLKFTGQKNRTDIPAIGSAVSVPFKKGWQYLWYYRRTQTVDNPGSPGDKLLLAKPMWPYVEDVYEYRSFAFLATLAAGLGGP